MPILITGGAGYIGSHTVLECLNAGHPVVVLDNLSNASAESLQRVETLTHKKIVFYEGGVEDSLLLEKIFKTHSIEAVIHFAGLKAVGESYEQPLKYYQNNVAGTLNVLKAMQQANVFHLILSSSASVYGNPAQVPVQENAPLQAFSPYGATKIMIERMVQDLLHADPRFKAVILRYFNPIGAHASGLIGEDPHGVPNNLVPFLMQVALRKHPSLSIFGQDYPTPDGTCVRDYVHVVDIARGHLTALNKLADLAPLSIYNLGTGQAYSVLELVQTFENVCGVKIPYKFMPRRPGDVALVYADVSRAKQALNWQAEYDLATMLKDAWRWQQQNPNGYEP